LNLKGVVLKGHVDVPTSGKDCADEIQLPMPKGYGDDDDEPED
jgi:hypothetical protein